MKLINCNLSDAKLLFKIHRESVNKGHLRSISRIPTFKIWKSWLQYKLFISKSKIFIGKIKNYKFGFTRFDHINKKNYEVSIGILSKHCNQGLGTKFLKLSIKKFTKIYKPKKIVCLIIKTNKRSEQCFKKNNFKLIKFDKRKHKTHNNPNLKKDNYFEYFEKTLKT
ncbi:MAG: GNAT family N-acetyltransferase [Pelagibacterales bacterium]|nr:GNAT family N-acetyltransferase [Pelagibacterales bacterium]